MKDALMQPTMDELKVLLRTFAEERDWEQFHSPKNLAMALTGEVGELVEIFQWLSEDQSKKLSEKAQQAVSEEMADVLLYLIRLSDVLHINLLEVASAKLQKNSEKYPVELSKGNAKKYTELRSK